MIYIRSRRSVYASWTQPQSLETQFTHKIITLSRALPLFININNATNSALTLHRKVNS